MPKISSKSKKRTEDDQMNKSLKAESDDILSSSNTFDGDGLVNFDSMGFKNPYCDIYGTALQQLTAEKESALSNFKFDEIKNEIQQAAEPRSLKSKEKPGKTSDKIRSSPYSIRERKNKVYYGEINIKSGTNAVTTTVPLRRFSLRQLNKTPEKLSESALEETVNHIETKVCKRGPLKMDEVVVETEEKEKWAEDMKRLGKYLAEGASGKEEPKPKGKDWKLEIERYKTAKKCWSYPIQSPENLDRFKVKVSKLRIWSGTVGRVLRERVTSMAVHPSKDCLLISAGGKTGTLGIWIVFPSMDGDNQGVKKEAVVDYPTGIYRYEPHDGLINCASFCRFGGDRLITSSYDGTVRVLNIEKMVFDQLYVSPADLRNNWMQWHCQISPNVFLASQGTGDVHVLDDRSDKQYGSVLNCYERSCRTVDIHPLHPQYLATSSSCGYTSIWDLRKFKRGGKFGDSGIKGIVNSSAALCHLGDDKRRLYSAFFSPVTGSGLLTTSSDDYIRLYDTSKLAMADSMSTYRVETSIRHNNRTGRWLTTFKAAWHPQRDDAFVVGCMEHPRQVEVFGRHGRLLASIGKDGPLPINTICSVNVFHPNRLVLASADSAGRVHVFL